MNYYNQVILEGIIHRRMLRESGELGLDTAVATNVKPNSTYAGFNPGGDLSTVVGGIAGIGADPSPKTANYGQRFNNRAYNQMPYRPSKADYMAAYRAYIEQQEEERRRRMGR